MASKMTVAHIAAEKQFPHFTLYRTKQNGGWEYDFVKLTAFFISRGYFIYRTSVHRFVPIRIIDNIVKEVGKKELKDEIINFLTNIDECPEYIHQFALKDIAKATNENQNRSTRITFGKGNTGLQIGINNGPISGINLGGKIA